MFLKGNGVPADTDEIITPGTRRLSQMFELQGFGFSSSDPGYVIESSCDLDLQEAEIDPFRYATDEQPARHVPDASDFVVLSIDSESKKP